MLFLAYPVEPTECIQNIAEKENINVEMMLFTSKLKPSRSHRMHFLEGRLSALHSCLAQESRTFRKHVKLIQVQLLKTCLETLW